MSDSKRVGLREGTQTGVCGAKHHYYEPEHPLTVDNLIPSSPE